MGTHSKISRIPNYPCQELGKGNICKVERALPSLEGVTALLDAGLAGVGEAAGTGMATDSVGIVPG